jgi:hypothetical protein
MGAETIRWWVLAVTLPFSKNDELMEQRPPLIPDYAPPHKKVDTTNLLGALPHLFWMVAVALFSAGMCVWMVGTGHASTTRRWYIVAHYLSLGAAFLGIASGVFASVLPRARGLSLVATMLNVVIAVFLIWLISGAEL